MKTIISKSGVIQRVKDDFAKSMVSHGGFKYCDKSTWKRLVRDKAKSDQQQASAEK